MITRPFILSMPRNSLGFTHNHLLRAENTHPLPSVVQKVDTILRLWWSSRAFVERVDRTPRQGLAHLSFRMRYTEGINQSAVGG